MANEMTTQQTYIRARIDKKRLPDSVQTALNQTGAFLQIF